MRGAKLFNFLYILLLFFFFFFAFKKNLLCGFCFSSYAQVWKRNRTRREKITEEEADEQRKEKEEKIVDELWLFLKYSGSNEWKGVQEKEDLSTNQEKYWTGLVGGLWNWTTIKKKLENFPALRIAFNKKGNFSAFLPQ